jgi:hypothetical protein
MLSDASIKRRSRRLRNRGAVRLAARLTRIDASAFATWYIATGLALATLFLAACSGGVYRSRRRQVLILARAFARRGRTLVPAPRQALGAYALMRLNFHPEIDRVDANRPIVLAAPCRHWWLTRGAASLLSGGITPHQWSRPARAWIGGRYRAPAALHPVSGRSGIPKILGCKATRCDRCPHFRVFTGRPLPSADR